MRTKIYNFMLIAALTVAGMATTACEKVDELPPTNDTGNSSKHYKVDNPTLMNDEQQAQYNEIKAEYDAATK